MANIDYTSDTVRAAFVKVEARATAAEALMSRSAFNMTDLPATYRVYQRSTSSGGGQGKGTGTIPVFVNVSIVGVPFFRIRSSDGTTILQQSTALPAFTATGAQTLNVTGIDARLGWFYVDLSVDGTTWKNGSTLVGMGRGIGLSGQSLAVAMVNPQGSETATNASLNVPINPNGSVNVSFGDPTHTTQRPGWLVPSDSNVYKSTGCSELLRLQIADAGVNCFLVGHTFGAQPISVFVPGGSQSADLRARLDEAGGFESFIWLQGHNDATNTPASYQSALTTLFSDVSSRNLIWGARYDKVLCDIPNIASTQYGTPAQKMALHAAVEAWCTANSATYVQPRDINLMDGIHQGQVGAIRFARHFDRAMRPGFGLSANDNGPVMGLASRSGATITIPVTHSPGATTLSSVGNPATRFSVFPAGTTTGALALASTSPIAVSSTTITLTLASDPGASTGVDVYFCYPPDPSNAGDADMIYDNLVDGDGFTIGRQLRPNLTARRIGGAGTAGAAATFVGSALTMTSPTYAADDSAAFGQALTGGYGVTASNAAGVLQGTTFAVAVRFKTTLAASTGTQIICSQGDRFTIGTGSDGRLTCNISPTTGGGAFIGGGGFTGGGTLPVVADGNWHWVVLNVTGTGATIYVDGTSVGSVTQDISTLANKTPFGVRTHGPSVGSFVFAGSISELAVFNANISATTPTTALSYTTSNIVELWHLDGSGAAASA